jgi:hypothetical protein
MVKISIAVIVAALAYSSTAAPTPQEVPGGNLGPDCMTLLILIKYESI